MPTSEIVPVYKITRPDRTTHEGYRWPIGDWQTFPGTGPLCGPGWAHFYLSPQLAMFLNPVHAAYEPMTLWAAEGVIGARDYALKVGCSRARLVREIAVPIIQLEQRVTFAIWCALAVYQDAGFAGWADSWLSGCDRTQTAAARRAAAARAAEGGVAARAAEWAARAAAAWAAEGGVADWAAARAVELAAGGAEASSRLNLVKLAAAVLLPWDPAHTEIKEK